MSATTKYTPELIDRFYSKVSKIPTETGCLEWMAYHDASGYGYFHVDGKPARAYRVAWEIVNGPIPDGMVIRHLCNNPLCCNPAHLKPGSHADNNRDMMRSGRWKNAPNARAPYVRPVGPTVAERFYAKVSKTPTDTGCLEWMAGCKPDGYGLFCWRGKACLAHRVAWELANGPIPEGMVIAHRCDNPRCCRVEHLSACTQTDNIHDMDAKGRRVSSKGEQVSKARVTEQDVLSMRSPLYSGWKQVDLARHFGISQGEVGKILRREVWAHIETDRDAPYESGSVKGEQHPAARITEQDVIAIRSDIYSGWTQRAIAEQFGISRAQVSNILLRKRWAHINATKDVPRESVMARGERCSLSKLTAQDVLAIRSDLYSGWTRRAIGEHFGISDVQVGNILRRKVWTHIP